MRTGEPPKDKQRKIAVILGTGPGLGAALAAALAPTHSLLLLSRSLPESLPLLKLPTSIDPSSLLAVSCDSSPNSLDDAFAKMRQKWPEGVVDVGIYNVQGSLHWGKFLERTESELREGLNAVVGAFNFGQIMIPRLLQSGGTLLFSGSSEAISGRANSSAMSPGSSGRRILSQALAREFGPLGVHVAFVNIDGNINDQRARDRHGEPAPGTRIELKDLTQVYLDLINQGPSARSMEVDVRPPKDEIL